MFTTKEPSSSQKAQYQILQLSPSEIARQQVAGVFSESLLLFPVCILCALFVTVLLWPDNNGLHLASWLVVVALTCFGLLTYKVNALRMQRSMLDEASDHQVNQWQYCMLGGAAVLGLQWSYAALAFLAPHMNMIHLIAASAFGGLLVFATTVYTYSLLAFCLFAIPPLLAIATHSLLNIQQNGPAYLALNLLFGFFIIFAAWRHARIRYRSLIKDMQTKSLIEHFRTNHAETQRLNESLSAEIEQRQLAETRLQSVHQELEAKIQDRTRAISEANDRLNQQVSLRKSISDALVKSQSRLAQAIEASRLGLWDWDLTTGQVYQSPFHDAFKQREMTSDEFIDNLQQVIHPDDYQQTKKALADYLKGQSPAYVTQYRVRDNQQNWLWIEDCGKAVKSDPNGKVLRMLGTRRNITHDRQRSEQLRLAKTIFDHTSEGVFILDEQFRFITINPAFEHITGYAENDLVGRSLIALSGTQQKTEVFEQARNALSSDGQWQAELIEKRKDGSHFTEWLRINAIRNERQQVTHYTGMLSDVTERKAADEKLHYLLNYDDLTGLANRAQFQDRLHQKIADSRENGRRFSLLLVDIDRFKYYNDSLGQEVGDRLLMLLAERLLDEVPNADTTARLGNDEFAMIIDQTGDTLASTMQHILQQLHKVSKIGSHEIILSCSIGGASFAADAHELNPLLHRAAIALRHAKYLGGNTFVPYQPELLAQSAYRLDLEQDLRRAIKEQALQVFYQPKVSLVSGRIDGVEALVRWQHPEKGLISPVDFVHMAEETGLISEVGAFVLHQACHQAKVWQDADLGDICLSVNVSPYQLRQQGLTDTVHHALTESGLEAQLLELELTESALMENLDASIELLNRLSSMGLNISVDDFGTGYSSLSYLKKFPIDALKIDRSFIRDVHINPEDAAITRAIIVMGHSLKLKVVAEGVEHADQVAFLKLHRCDQIQGYIVSKPLSGPEMTELLHRQKTDKPSFL